jgi:hypothetical protein
MKYSYGSGIKKELDAIMDKELEHTNSNKSISELRAIINSGSDPRLCRRLKKSINSLIKGTV